MYLPKPWMGDNFFALGGGLYCGETWWGEAIWGEILFFSLSGGIIQGLVVSIYLKENLPVVNINYLLMTYNFKDKLRHLL